MTCKDCIHYKPCRRANNSELNGSEYSCRDFKDKSKIFEFPCEVGDKIFEISDDKICYWEVKSILIEKSASLDKCILSNETIIALDCIEINTDLNYEKYTTFFISDVDKTIFFNYEEAKRRLKENEK